MSNTPDFALVAKTVFTTETKFRINSLTFEGMTWGLINSRDLKSIEYMIKIYGRKKSRLFRKFPEITNSFLTSQPLNIWVRSDIPLI